MKLVTFKKNNQDQLGVKINEGIIDIREALLAHPMDAVPSNVMEVIAGGPQAVALLDRYINELKVDESQAYFLSENDLEWGPCVTQPSKIICVGLNYRKHADETNAAYPEVPILFNKFNNTLTGNQSEIAVPQVTEKLDYEVELGVVIGKTAKNVSKEEALDYVFGYCTANDLSARDLQMRTQQWLLGKTCDDFSPIGPYLVTSDEIKDPQDLALKTFVNGEIRQNSNTSDMIFSCDEIISYISQHMTLEPGDLILTGSPAGVGKLSAGDEVEVEILGYSRVKNPVTVEA